MASNPPSSSRKRKISNAVDISDDEDTDGPKPTFSFKQHCEFEKFAIKATSKTEASKLPSKRSAETLKEMNNRLKTKMYIKEAEKLMDNIFVEKSSKMLF
uniref:Uncharacterized protein n=1 Tax=Panagrolaimus superbus TaxID=310955 RepID=A0A914YUJ0_9BILA